MVTVDDVNDFENLRNLIEDPVSGLMFQTPEIVFTNCTNYIYDLNSRPFQDPPSSDKKDQSNEEFNENQLENSLQS